jgi:hypothetical protein
MHRLDGGYAALHGLFREKLETFSGGLRDKLAPVEIVVRRGRAVGVRVQPRDETIGCEHLVWAGSAADLHAVCAEKPPRRAPSGAPGLHVEGYRYALAMLVRPDALPEGMAERVVLIGDPTRPLVEENALAVTVGQAAPRQADQIPVWVECVVPAPPVDAGPDYLRALRGRVVDRLQRLLPFFQEHLVVLGSPHDGLPPEVPGARASSTSPATSRKSAPTTVPASPLPVVYGLESDSRLDAAALPHATGVRNLYLAGRENLPGLGLEGELISAWGVVRLIGGAKAKRDPLRREVLISE